MKKKTKSRTILSKYEYAISRRNIPELVYRFRKVSRVEHLMVII